MKRLNMYELGRLEKLRSILQNDKSENDLPAKLKAITKKFRSKISGYTKCSENAGYHSKIKK